MADQTISKRIAWLDLAKGFGIIFVILAHITGGRNWFFYSFHLPLFFLISGYLFHYEPNGLRFFAKKCKSYLLPYVLMALVISAFCTYTQHIPFKIELMLFLAQKRYTTLWFLTALFLSVIIYWLIQKICRQNRKWVFACSLVLSIIFWIYDAVTKAPLFWNLDTAFIAVGFLAVGQEAKQHQLLEKTRAWSSKKRTKWFFLFLLFNLVLTLTSAFITHETLEMYYCKYGIYPMTFLAACCGTMFIVLLSQNLEIGLLSKRKTPIRRYIHYCGEHSLLFFGLHQAIYMEIATMILRPYGIWYGNRFIPNVIATVTTFIIVMVLGTIVERVFALFLKGIRCIKK